MGRGPAGRVVPGPCITDRQGRETRDFMACRLTLRSLFAGSPEARGRGPVGLRRTAGSVLAIGLTLAASALLLLPAPGEQARAESVKAKATQIITTRGCAACHYVPGIPQATGTLGPSLKGLSARDRIAGGRLENSPENLRRWLQNPKAVLSSTMMPNLGLSDEEIEVLIEFFQTL